MLQRSRTICVQDKILKLPKPIYEALPFFLIGAGILFITLVLNHNEYAPTVFIWLVGLFCVLGGILILTIRLIYRIKSRTEDMD
jgi:hypothetical protein